MYMHACTSYVSLRRFGDRVIVFMLEYSATHYVRMCVQHCKYLVRIVCLQFLRGIRDTQTIGWHAYVHTYTHTYIHVRLTHTHTIYVRHTHIHTYVHTQYVYNVLLYLQIQWTPSNPATLGTSHKVS